MIALKPLIEKLRAHGLDADAILDIVSEAVAVAPPAETARTARQERNARYYEKRASDKRLKASEIKTPEASYERLKPSYKASENNAPEDRKSVV